MANTQRSFVGIGIAVAIGIATLVAVVPDDNAQAVSHAQETTQAVEVDSTSTILVSPVTSTSTTVTQPSQTKRGKIQAHPVRSKATTTSEVPPPLTPEQEENIPDSDQETFERGDAFDPMDYNLPSEVKSVD